MIEVIIGARLKRIYVCNILSFFICTCLKNETEGQFEMDIDLICSTEASN